MRNEKPNCPTKLFHILSYKNCYVLDTYNTARKRIEKKPLRDCTCARIQHVQYSTPQYSMLNFFLQDKVARCSEVQYNTSKINMKICLRFDWGKSAEFLMSSLFLNFRGGQENIDRNNITGYHIMPCHARQCYMTLTTRCWSFHVSPQADVRCMYVALCDVNT